MSDLSASLLAQTIDDHIAWMTAWTRRAFYERQGSSARTESPPLPESFTVWRGEATKALRDQPSLSRLIGLYDQLHRLAPLALWKAPEGMPVPVSDYDAVATLYQELIIGLRRLELALSPSASSFDALTGLRSLAGMRDDLTRELSRFQRSGKPFSIAIMAIDSFQKIMETRGRENGDKIFSAVSNYICRCLRPFDDTWLWGKDEILMCLKEADLIAGNLALKRVREGLQRLPITLTTGKEINITASFGITAAAKTSTVDELLSKAGKALFRAKTKGKNQIESSLLID